MCTSPIHRLQRPTCIKIIEKARMADMLGEQRCVYIAERCINYSQGEHLIYCMCSSVLNVWE